MVAVVEPDPEFKGIFWVRFEDGHRRLATRNIALGRAVYGEQLVKYEGVEYRIWDAHRSKLAAGIMNGLEVVPIQPDDAVLYLGAASGTTASHVSDIVGEKGNVYCIEFAARSIRELVDNVCVYRGNMSPVLADARLPESYASLVGKVEDIYCDIAQPEQAKVLADNADMFLDPKGWIVLAVKAQSIDVTKEPSEVYEQEMNVLRTRTFRVRQVVDLEPYHKAHALIVAQKT